MLQCLNLDKDLYWNFTSYSILFKQSSLHIIFANVWPFNLFNLILNSCPYVCDQYSSDVSCCDIVYWPLAPNSVARFGPKVGHIGIYVLLGPNGINPGLFQIRFQWNLIWSEKVPNLSHLGQHDPLWAQIYHPWPPILASVEWTDWPSWPILTLPHLTLTSLDLDLLPSVAGGVSSTSWFVWSHGSRAAYPSPPWAQILPRMPQFCPVRPLSPACGELLLGHIGRLDTRSWISLYTSALPLLVLLTHSLFQQPFV